MSADAQARPVVWTSVAVMLIIVKVVLFLSVFSLELENTFAQNGLFLSVITPNMVWCLLIWYHVCWWLSKLYYPLVSLSLSWRIHYQPAWSIQCLLMPWQHRLSGHQLPLCWQLSKLSYSLVSLLPTWWIYGKPKWSTSCLLMIVKVVLLLSAIILESKNTLPTRIGNSVTADALGTQFFWTSVAVVLTIVQVVLFLTIFTSEMVNTKSTQMVDIMSADAQATQLAWASATVILMIVKVVLLLSVLILDSENALPTSMVNTLSADFIDLSMLNIDII